MSPSSAVITHNASFRPVVLKPHEIVTETQRGREVFRLLTLLMRQQIRDAHYPHIEKLNWSQIASHINTNIKVNRSSGLDKAQSQLVVSDDTLRLIEQGDNRSRNDATIEAIGLCVTNPLTGQPLSFYEMKAILRTDYTAYPDFDALLDRLYAILEPHRNTPAFVVSRIIKATIADLKRLGDIPRSEPPARGLADYLNKKIRTQLFDAATVEMAINPPPDLEGYSQPFMLLTTLQTYRLPRHPLTGAPYALPDILTSIIAGDVDVDGNPLN